MLGKVCEYCNKKYDTYYKPQRFCSRVCFSTALGYQKGRIVPDEDRAKIAESNRRRIGTNNPMYGRHQTEETKLKISLAMKRHK